MTLTSYSDTPRRYLTPTITYARSPSSSSGTRTMYSSTTSSSQSSSAGYYQPSLGYQQSSTRPNSGYYGGPGHNYAPGEHRYRVSSNDAKYVAGTVRETSQGKFVEVIHQPDRKDKYEPAEPRTSHATSSDIRGPREPRNSNYGRSYTPRY